VAAEGAIYDMWDPAVHVYKDQPFPVQDYYVSIDYGTANPTAFLLFGVNGKQALCLKEYYYDSSKSQRQMTDAEYAVEFKKFVGDLKIKSVIIDPSAASFRTQLRKDGWFVRDANNDVLDGIRTVSTMLHERRLYVHESCKNLIRELPGYAWDPKAQQHGEDKPMKVNDHAVDAARYFCHTVMGKGGYFIPKRGLY
jgi:PBSX family phage terminase large subunit